MKPKLSMGLLLVLFPTAICAAITVLFSVAEAVYASSLNPLIVCFILSITAGFLLIRAVITEENKHG